MSNLLSTENFLKEKARINIFNDPYQIEYVYNLINSTKKTQAVFVDAMAGTGKTSIAVSVAYYLLQKSKIDQIVYIRSAVAVRDMGFLPGDVAEKEAPYMQAGLHVLSRMEGEQDNLVSNLINEKKLVVASTAYLRGVDWDNRKFIIIDEAQNLTKEELQMTLTRAHDNCKVVIIGSSIQSDSGSHVKKVCGLLPFQLFAYHFTQCTNLNVKSINLVNNYRGAFSLAADKIDDTIKKLNKENNIVEAKKPLSIDDQWLLVGSKEI